MTYKNYIKLGFDRSDLDCSVMLNNTGYGGFTLTKLLKNKSIIQVVSDDLENPQLLVPYRTEWDRYYYVNITTEIAESLIELD